MRVATIVSFAVVFGFQPCLWAGEPRREAVHSRGVEKEPEWKRELRRKLQEKVSFEFVNTPLSEALMHLSQQAKTNIVLDLREETGWGTRITLTARDMSLENALRWLLKEADLDYEMRDEAIFITIPERFRSEVVLKVYDVRDLTHWIPRGPAYGWVGFPKPQAADAGVPEGLISSGALAELIQTRIRPVSWAAELGTSIEEREGRLVVMQRPAAHREIERFLRRHRAERSLQVRVEVRFLALPESLLAKLRALEQPGDGTIFLRQPQLDLIAGALESGEVRQVDAVNLTCMNGQVGSTRRGKLPDGKSEGGKAAFQGTILEVQPFVSFDRKYVTMHLNLKRLEGCQLFESATALTCLDTDTVLLAGAALPGEDPPRRLVALVTPTILRLEPQESAPVDE